MGNGLLNNKYGNSLLTISDYKNAYNNGLMKYASKINTGRLSELTEKVFAGGGYSQLEVLNMPNVETITSRAFAGFSTTVETINAQKLLSINTNAFFGCINLKSVDFPNLTTIPSNAFNDCNNLEYVCLSGCTTIEDYAFSGLSKLRLVYIDKCLSIGHRAFQNCYSLITISMYNCKSIASLAFYNCSSLNSLSTPNVINMCIDSMPSRLSYLSFPGLMTLSSDTIYGTMSDGTICFKNVITVYSNSCNAKIIDLPKCNIIGTSAFIGCSYLTNISAPLLKTISSYAFYSLSRISIINFPMVENVYDHAFDKCTSLENILLSKVKYIGSTNFINCSKLSYLYFPECLSFEAYNIPYNNSLKPLMTLYLPKVKTFSYTYVYNYTNDSKRFSTINAGCSEWNILFDYSSSNNIISCYTLSMSRCTDIIFRNTSTYLPPIDEDWNHSDYALRFSCSSINMPRLKNLINLDTSRYWQNVFVDITDISSFNMLSNLENIVDCRLYIYGEAEYSYPNISSINLMNLKTGYIKLSFQTYFDYDLNQYYAPDIYLGSQFSGTFMMGGVARHKNAYFYGGKDLWFSDYFTIENVHFYSNVQSIHGYGYVWFDNVYFEDHTELTNFLVLGDDEYGFDDGLGDIYGSKISTLHIVNSYEESEYYIGYGTGFIGIHMPKLSQIDYSNPTTGPVSDWSGKVIFVDINHLELGFSNASQFMISQGYDMPIVTLSLPNINCLDKSFISGSMIFSELTALTAPKVEYIGSSIFSYNNSGITFLDFPLCSIIYERGLCNLTNLSYLSIPNCEMLGSYALYNCISLSFLDLPKCSVINNYALPQNTKIFRFGYSGIVSIGIVQNDNIQHMVQVPESLYSSYLSDSTWSNLLSAHSNWTILAYRR